MRDNIFTLHFLDDCLRFSSVKNVYEKLLKNKYNNEDSSSLKKIFERSINDAQIQCVDKTPRDNYKEKENNKCSRSSSNYTLKYQQMFKVKFKLYPKIPRISNFFSILFLSIFCNILR